MKRVELIYCVNQIIYIMLYVTENTLFSSSIFLKEGEFPIPDGPISRDLAATSQYWFTKYHCDELAKCLEEYHSDPKNPAIDGIVVTGGCGLVSIS